MHAPVRIASLIVTIFVSALLVCAAQATTNRHALGQTQAESCLTTDEDIFGVCAASHPNATQTDGLRLAFDQTKPPKKVKKRKQVAPVDPTTGIVEEQTRRLRTHGTTTSGVQIKGPHVPNKPAALTNPGGTTPGGTTPGGTAPGGTPPGGTTPGGTVPGNIPTVTIGTMRDPLTSKD